ncbi:glycosyltransferase family 2 protein [Bacillus sp. X1(2014)]|uniref:glycosyltransferase family 2 protein n=1 Tax=Bacillus sp. X1(2014) TaxID=1565991 RepID=UPI001642AC4B|nr:glycosyltransferase [Bacillus sp. X1(2014)]
MKVSILMLTHNAPRFVKESIETVKEKTRGIEYELIVVDNASRITTKLLLRYLKAKGLIDVLYLNKENSLFAKGNNIASSYCSSDSNLILLLNSDIRINSDDWLQKLAELHPSKGGIASYGVVEDEPYRADGYCMLIDRELYDKYKLDEEFAWFWSVTKLQSLVLKEGKSINAVRNHEEYIHHYGGKSGKGFKNAAGMGINISDVKAWFTKGTIDIIDKL